MRGKLTSPTPNPAGDGTSIYSSLSEKTRISNPFLDVIERQHIRLNYFKTLRVGPTLIVGPALSVGPATRKYDRIAPVLKELHWLPVKQRIIFKI